MANIGAQALNQFSRIVGILGAGHNPVDRWSRITISDDSYHIDSVVGWIWLILDQHSLTYSKISDPIDPPSCSGVDGADPCKRGSHATATVRSTQRSDRGNTHVSSHPGYVGRHCHGIHAILRPYGLILDKNLITRLRRRSIDDEWKIVK